MKTDLITRILGLSIVGMLLASCDAENGDDSSASESGTFDSAPGKVIEKTYQMNEKVSLSDSEWTVLVSKNLGSTLAGDDDEGIDPKESDGKFVYVRYKIVNNTKSNEEIIFTPTLQDSQGRNFEQMDSMDAMDYLQNNETTMDAEQLPSGVPKTFSAIFEVPKDSNGLVFLARTISDVLQPELAPVNLKLD